MSTIGVFGGRGPSATVDFMEGLCLLDSPLELARASVNYALERGWNRPGWDC